MEINESLILSFQHVTEELRKGGMKGIIWEMDRMLAVSSVFWASGVEGFNSFQEPAVDPLRLAGGIFEDLDQMHQLHSRLEARCAASGTLPMALAA